jgi:hypothetical protein
MNILSTNSNLLFVAYNLLRRFIAKTPLRGGGKVIVFVHHLERHLIDSNIGDHGTIIIINEYKIASDGERFYLAGAAGRV